MSMLEDVKKSGIATLALGAGVLALVPAVLPVLVHGVRPLLKGAVKGGLVCLEKGREAVAEIHHVLDDVAAESQAEAHARREAAAPSARPASRRQAEPAPEGVAPSPSAPIIASTGEPDPEVMG